MCSPLLRAWRFRRDRHAERRPRGTLSVAIGEPIFVAAIDRIAGQYRPSGLIEKRVAAHEHGTATADFQFARNVRGSCHGAHGNGHAAERRSECGFDDPRGGTRDERSSRDRASDAFRHRPILETDDLVLHEPQSAQPVDPGPDGDCERCRDGSGSVFEIEPEQTKAHMHARLFHLLFERAHALRLDSALDGTTRDEGAEADAPQDQAFERQSCECLAYGRAGRLEAFRELGFGWQAMTRARGVRTRSACAASPGCGSTAASWASSRPGTCDRL